MHLDYIDDLPFEYLISDVNKDIKLSDEIKNEFNHYYINIRNSNNKDIDRWTQEAKRLKKLVELEILESGNQKSIYVTEYVQFIFGVSYLFFNKFHMTQKEVASILGMTTTKYSKLDIFPYRCYSAFTKLDDKKKRKSLIPNDIDSEGIRIAECINKKVQARYACCGFIGVSNDLDLFTNISSTDKKRFVKTVPSDISQKLQIAMECAGFMFATANNFENIQGRYVAGDVKRKIIELLDMSYKADFSYYPDITEVLEDDEECWKFLAKESQLENSLLEYRIAGNILEDIHDGRFYVHEDIDLLNIPNNIDIFDDNSDEFVNWLEEKREECKDYLLGNMTFTSGRNYNASDFVNYRLCLYQEMIEKMKINYKSSSVIECMNSSEDKIRFAAIYWMFNVFVVDPVDEKKYKAVRKWLKTRHLLSYIDSINKELDKDGKPHIALMSDGFDIITEITGFCDTKMKQYRPVMVYIDTKAYPDIESYFEPLLKNLNIVLIIRDKDNIVKKWHMQELDRNLNLYFMEGNKDAIQKK